MHLAWQETGVGVLGPGQPGDQSEDMGTADADSSAGSSGEASGPPSKTPLSKTPASKPQTLSSLNPRAIAVGVVTATLAVAGSIYASLLGKHWNGGYPASLMHLWSPGRANVLVRRAVMAFQSQHNMAIDGRLTPKLWGAMFRAEAKGDGNRNGYTYAVAYKGSPETLTIWHDGRVVLHSLANTGMPVRPPLMALSRCTSGSGTKIMSGTNPDGSHWADPVSFVSYFNGGDGVHYFPRGSYGSEQSRGCVELPYGMAQQAYPYLTYGSLVTVHG